MSDNKVFMPVEDFHLLYTGGLSLPTGAYNHRFNLVNIDGVTFWSKGFTMEANLMVAAWHPRVTYHVAIYT